LVIDLVATAGEEAGLIDFEDVAGPFEHPLDPAIAARLALIVIDRGDEGNLATHRAGPLFGPNDETKGVRVKICEGAGYRRFGVSANDVAGWPEIGKVAGIVRDAA